MTIEGAIAQLQELIDNDGIPFWAKPSLQKVMETVEAEREEHLWIPVTERLPEEDGRYLCTYKNDAYGDGICIDFGLYEDGEWYVSGAIAWMPLPEPYKEGAEE